MPTVSSKGGQSGDGSTSPASNHTLTEPYPDQLRNLVFNYLCHNCYLKSAEAFAKDSAIGHIDKDGDESRDRVTSRDDPGSELSTELIRNIQLRQRIQLRILSGDIQEAIDLLNHHFPMVLAEDDGDDDMEVTDENVNPSHLEYTAETTNPIHLYLNLRILAFIEACRTVPLVYSPPAWRTKSPASSHAEVRAAVVPIKRDPKDEEQYQSELLICVQRLYATVNRLRKQEDRALYLKELNNVGGLLAYTVPENSPMAKYLHQERRDRVAEQINSAILRHVNMPSVSYLELAVRYTHCLWASLHDLHVKVPSTRRLSGFYPPGTSTNEPEKESSHEAQPFDLQHFLDTRT